MGMTQQEATGHETTGHETTGHETTGRAVNPALMVLAWLWVLVPFSYGLYQLVIKIPALFGH
jgi:hypothetical protein